MIVQNDKTWKEFSNLVDWEMGITTAELRDIMDREGFFVSREKIYIEPTIDEAVDAIFAYEESVGESWAEDCMPSGLKSIEYVAYLVDAGYRDRIDEMFKEGYFMKNPYLHNTDLYVFEHLYDQEHLVDEAWEKAYRNSTIELVKFIKHKNKLRELMESLEL